MPVVKWIKSHPLMLATAIVAGALVGALAAAGDWTTGQLYLGLLIALAIVVPAALLLGERTGHHRR